MSLLPRVGSFFLFFFLFSQEVFAQIVINEFLPKPIDSVEWVEFYNLASSSADLSDYLFDDDANFASDGGSLGKNKIPLLGILPANSSCFWDLGEYLNDSGDTPTLFGIDGGIVDTYPYSSSKPNLSYGRVPDGGNWQIEIPPTKPSSNCLDLIQAITQSPPSSSSAQPQTLSFDLGSEYKLGEIFNVNVQLSHFDPNTEFYLKVRGGTEETVLNKVQTKSGESYFGDSESWQKFPLLKTDQDGNWGGQIEALVAESKPEGTYKIRLRLHKKDTDTSFDSSLKEATFHKPDKDLGEGNPSLLVASVASFVPDLTDLEDENATAPDLVLDLPEEILGASVSTSVGKMASKPLDNESLILFWIGLGSLTLAFLYNTVYSLWIRKILT